MYKGHPQGYSQESMTLSLARFLLWSDKNIDSVKHRYFSLLLSDLLLLNLSNEIF